MRYSGKTAINRETNVNNWTTIGGTCANYSTADNCYLASGHPGIRRGQSGPGDAASRGRRGFSVRLDPAVELYDAQHPESAFAHVKTISGQDIDFGSLDNPTQSTTSTVTEHDYAAYFAQPRSNRLSPGSITMAISACAT